MKIIRLFILFVVLLCNGAFAESGYIKHVGKNAKTGQAWAENAMGDAFFYGIDMEPDYKKAFEWYRKAAAQGDSNAMSTLGDAYYYGVGGEENYKKAAEWYRKAADAGDDFAVYFLAEMYRQGTGVDQDLPEAEKLYQKSINEHSSVSMLSLFSLAQMYWENKEILKLMGAVPSLFQISVEQLLEEDTMSGIGVRVAVAKDASEPLPAEDVFERVWRSVVYIETQSYGEFYLDDDESVQIDFSDKSGSGGGVIVQPDIVATSCHVVDGVDEIVVYQLKERGGTGNAFTVYGSVQSGEKDYCLLYVPDLLGEAVPATIRPYDTLKIGETVYALGAPEGEKLSLSKGIISQLRDEYAYPAGYASAPAIQSDVASAPGYSGGGLFDSAGNLIGHPTFGLDGEGLGFFIPADIVLEF